MFFFLSKTLALLATPHYLAAVLVLAALLLRLGRRAPRLRRALVVVAVLELWLLSTGVVANLLLLPLETRVSRPEKLTEDPGAIVMLTGVTDNHRLGTAFDFTEGADRFIEALRLAHRYPRAMLLISGGSSEIVDKRYREADALGGLARELGVPARRLLLERDARNTHENAVFSDRVLREAGVKGPVLLVTSALHMPRALGCFAKVGRKVTPWPVDYLRTGWWGSAWLPKPSSLGKSDAAIHEVLGWLSYRLSGYL